MIVEAHVKLYDHFDNTKNIIIQNKNDENDVNLAEPSPEFSPLHVISLKSVGSSNTEETFFICKDKDLYSLDPIAVYFPLEYVPKEKNDEIIFEEKYELTQEPEPEDFHQ